MNCSMPGFPVLPYLLEFAQTHVQWVGDAIQTSHSLSSPPLLHSIFPSTRVFSDESVFHIRWPKYWSFSFSISPSNEYSRLISYRIDWFDLLALQRTLKSLLQHYSLKAPVLWCSTFFIVQHHNWKGPSLASPPSASMGYTLREGHWVMTKWWVLSHSKASWKKT